jgi:hypothetical protein
MRLIWLFAVSLMVNGQTLQVSSVSTPRGESGSVRISLTSPAGSAPAALQWELSYPAEQITIERKNLVVGSAAQSAGKELSCAGRWLKAPQTYAYKCVLAGGQKTMHDGTVALVTFNVPGTASPGRAVLQLSEALGASPEAKEIKIKAGQGAVTIP